MVGLKVGEEVLFVGLLMFLLRLWDHDKVELLSEVLVVVLGRLFGMFWLLIVDIVSQLL